MTQIPKNWRDYLKECLEIDEGLDDWQLEFITGLEKAAKYAFFTLTVKQWEKLNEIWTELI